MIFILQVLFGLEEFLRYFLLYDGILNIKKKNKKIILLGTIAFCVCYGVVLKAFPSIYSTILLILHLLFTMLVFDIKKINIMLAFIPTFFALSFFDEISYMLAGYLLHFNPMDMLEDTFIGYKMLAEGISLFVFAFFAWKNRKRGKHTHLSEYMSKTGYFLLTASTISLVILISIVSYGIFTPNEEDKVLLLNGILIFSITSVLIVILIVFYMVDMIKNQKMHEELLDIYKKKNYLQAQYYKTMMEKNEEIRAFQHDFHHHMNYIKEQVSKDNLVEVKKYVQELSNNSDFVLKRDIYTGNAIVDAIILDFVSRKENDKIRFESIGKLNNEIGIEDIDLVVLLSNAIENAGEASRKCNRNGYIKFEVTKYKENIIFKISNTYDGKLEADGSKMLSMKDHNRHGYGIRNMKQIVDKYDGEMQITYNQKMFELLLQVNEQ